MLEFGRFGDDLTAYILVSNLLSRRIHDRYVQQKEEAEGGTGREPRPLVLVIEEAHKFLSPSIAPQTIFGTIARELRKYNVTLMVIDQRPSVIDSEVMSQLGTRLTCLLDNERDIEAVLSGTPAAGRPKGRTSPSGTQTTSPDLWTRTANAGSGPHQGVWLSGVFGLPQPRRGQGIREAWGHTGGAAGARDR